MLKRLLAPLGALLLTLGLAACGSGGGDAASDSSSSATPSASESPAGVTCTYTPGGEAARPVDPPPATPGSTEPVDVTIETSAGELHATLSAETAPCTVNSFTSLAAQGFYDDTPCPRITTEPGFSLLQCGDPTGTTAGGPGYTYADELTGQESYGAGTLAMANGGPNTNRSQFFIVYGDTQLQPAYTVFGSVDNAGLKIIQGIAADGDDGSNPAGGGAPNTPIDIVKVTVE